jgi:acetylornithine deacetylase/succinyl-diaminopimelate desuccinylase-like protein
MTIDRERTESLLADLVRIDSVTPWLIPGGAGEAEVASFIASWLADLPVDLSIEEIEPGRVNLLATLGGSGGGSGLCLNAHADTVGYGNWADRALRPKIEGDRMIGLGVADDKSGCAAGMLALRELVETGASLRGNVVLACVADEEGVSIGTEALVRDHAFDAVIVVEPDALPRLVVEHQGFGWIDVIVHGRPAHGSAPEEGIDAIVHMAEVIRRLDARDREVFAAKADPMNGKTVFHTGTVHGGTDYATYPANAVLGIEIGTQPGEQLTDRLREIDATFDECRQVLSEFRAEVRVRLDRDPFRAEGHEPTVEALNAAATKVIGQPFELCGLNAWTDAALTQAAGMPTVLLGPAGGNFHAPDEWVSISEVVALAQILAETARIYSG